MSPEAKRLFDNTTMSETKPSATSCFQSKKELSAAGGRAPPRASFTLYTQQTATYIGSVQGWPVMLSSLKSILETGKPLAAN